MSRLWLVLVMSLSALVGGCADSSGSSPARSEDNASCLRTGGRLKLVNPLQGYALHDGRSTRDGCRLLLVGEQLEPSRGVVLESVDGGRTTRVAAAFPTALHLRTLTESAGRVWIGGDTRQGKGILLARSDAERAWRQVPLPDGVNEVRDVAVVAGDLWVAGSARGSGVLFKQEGVSWREVARVRSLTGGPAALTRVSLAGRTVVAAGTDGASGVVVFVAARGEHSRTIRPRRLSGAVGIAAATDAVWVAGYEAKGGIVENATGLLLQTTGSGTRPRFREFAGSVQILDVSWRSQATANVIASTGRGDVVWRTRTRGETWMKLRGLQALSIERFIEGESTYVVGGSGLVRVP